MKDHDDQEVDEQVIPKKGENYFCPKTGAHFNFKNLCKKVDNYIRNDPYETDRYPPATRDIKQNEIKISKIPNTEKRRKIIANKQSEKYNLDSQDGNYELKKEIMQVPHQTQITEQDEIDDGDQDRQNKLFKALKNQAKISLYGQTNANSRQQTFTTKGKTHTQKLNSLDYQQNKFQSSNNNINKLSAQKVRQQQAKGKILFPPSKIMFNKQTNRKQQQNLYQKPSNESYDQNIYSYKTKRITTEPDEIRIEQVQNLNSVSKGSLYGSPLKKKSMPQKNNGYMGKLNMEIIDQSGANTYLMASQKQQTVPLQNKHKRNQRLSQNNIDYANGTQYTGNIKIKQQSQHNLTQNRQGLHRRNQTEQYGQFKTPNIINGQKSNNISIQQTAIQSKNKSPIYSYKQSTSQLNNGRASRSLRASQ